jgi:hypothetical protein
LKLGHGKGHPSVFYIAALALAIVCSASGKAEGLGESFGYGLLGTANPARQQI